MIQTKVYDHLHQPTPQERNHIARFLFTYLDEYGDTLVDIQKAIDYALKMNETDGGLIVTARENNVLVGAAVINRTGMEGYIPENILVYIATHTRFRGKGIGSMLLETIIGHTDGNIALHVEHDNPAIQLYRKFGFTNKYLEMRLNKKEQMHGLSNA